MGLRNRDHIIATGTIGTQASIDAQTKIEAFPTQADQSNIPWTAPDRNGTTVPEPAQIRQGPTKAVGVGYYQWQWAFNYWTFGMMDYVLDTFLTTSGDRVRSKAVSVRAYDLEDAAIYLNATLLWPQREPQDAGWQNIILRFVNGTLVTS